MAIENYVGLAMFILKITIITMISSKPNMIKADIKYNLYII